MFPSGPSFVRTTWVNLSLNASNFNGRQAWAEGPEFGNTTWSKSDDQSFSITCNPFSIGSAVGFLLFSHDFSGRLRDVYAHLIGLRFNQGLPSDVDFFGEVCACEVFPLAPGGFYRPTLWISCVTRWSLNCSNTTHGPTVDLSLNIDYIGCFDPHFHIVGCRETHSPGLIRQRSSMSSRVRHKEGSKDL